MPVPAVVRYGANDTYEFKYTTDTVACNDETFGDPISSVVKNCDYLLSEGADFDADGLVDSEDPYPTDPMNGTAENWHHCASEGYQCAVPLNTLVRYGANDSYGYQEVTGSVTCNNATFGDTAHGVAKNCYYYVSVTEDSDGDGVVDSEDFMPTNALVTKDTDGDNIGDYFDPQPADPNNDNASNNWLYCSGEWTECHVPVPSVVRYGANNTYVFEYVDESVTCANIVFGDPIGGVAKQCDYLFSDKTDHDADGLVDSIDPYPADPMNGGDENWRYCSTEGGTMRCTNDHLCTLRR